MKNSFILFVNRAGDDAVAVSVRSLKAVIKRRRLKLIKGNYKILPDMLREMQKLDIKHKVEPLKPEEIQNLLSEMAKGPTQH